MTNDRPNICFILIDSVRADHFPCYGYSRISTPNIDRIAQEGVVYDNAIVAAPWTLQSVSSIFTGLYPSQHGVSWGHQTLDKEHSTLAEMLNDGGYYTVGWSANPWIDPRTDLSRGFTEFVQTGRVFNTSSPGKLQRAIEKAYMLVRSRIVANKGGEQLVRLAQKHFKRLSSKSSPFFNFMFYLEPHSPYQPNKKTANQLLPADVSHRQALNINWRPNDYYVGKSKLTAKDFKVLTDLYDAEIVGTDERIGKNIKALEEAGILDDTIVVIAGDHGENFGDHGLVGHGYGLHDSLVRVPLIIRYPKRFPAGTRINDQVQVQDLVPTLLELAGVDLKQYPKLSQNRSLLPEKMSSEPRKWTFSEHIRPSRETFYELAKKYPNFNPTRYVQDRRSIRGDGWKYVSVTDGSKELYDLSQDADENKNLAETKPEKAKELHAYLDDNLPMSGSEGATVMEMDDLTLKHLRSLGYVD